MTRSAKRHRPTTIMPQTDSARAPLEITAVRITIAHIPPADSAEDIGAIKCHSLAITRSLAWDGGLRSGAADVPLELSATLYVPGEHTREEAEGEARQWAEETDWRAVTATDHPMTAVGREVTFSGVFEVTQTEL
jgi:hypothetical protein